MRLTAVIPTLDEAASLPGVLRRVRVEADEVIVVDGGSSDETVACAEAGGARVVHAPRGRGDQLAAGAKEARGDRIWFLHADTAVPVGSGAKLRAATSRWGCFAVRIDGAHPLLRSTERMMCLRARLTGSCTGDMGMWFDRDFYEELGGFAAMRICEDLDLSDRARGRAAWTVLCPPLRTSGRRWEKHGVVRTMGRMWTVRAAWRMGRDPESLVRWYERELR